MLKLRQLEISGFKSFVEPVTLGFAPGITAIVGPNGCGKSNLSDAISWALGEQSARSLRSGTMEDVIFNGAERRKPLGLAEVSLILETDPSFEGSEDGRIVINRRVFRGGEGQYRLNGKRVPLKQIRDLLLGTGLGIRAYSIIEQGKIGLILSGKPQERRRLLEEAAGVTRYKDRRRVAEVKLEEATANLTRLEDVVLEVERALRSLKRQASAARRYQEAQGELEGLLETVLLGRWSEVHSRLAEQRRELDEATGRDGELVADLHRLEADLAERRESLEALGRETAQLHRRDAEAATRIEGRQQFLQGARETLQQLAERLAAGRALAAERRREQERHVETRQSLQERRAELEEERKLASAAVSGDAADLATRDRAAAEAEGRVERLRRELLESIGRLEEVRGDLHRQQTELEKARLSRAHLLEEVAEHQRDLATARQGEARAAEQVTEIREQMAAREAGRDEQRRRLDQALTTEGETTHRAQAAGEALRALAQRRELLEELDLSHARGRQALQVQLAACEIENPTFLSDRLQAPPGWERSLDLFLGPLADAVVVPPGRDPMVLARSLVTSQTSATLVVPLEEAPPAATPEDPAVVGAVQEVLRADAGLVRALPPAFLVEEAADAARLAAAHPGCAFLSREQVWAQGGLLHLAGERRQPGVLERRQELEAIDRELPERREAHRSAEAELTAAVTERTTQAQELHRLEAAVADLHRDLAVAEARHEDAAELVRRLERQESAFGSELGRLDEQIGIKVTRVEELASRRSEIEASHRELETSFDVAQGEVDQARRERENLRAAGAERRGLLELLDERLRTHEQEAARLERDSRATVEHLAAWAADEEHLEARQRELEAAISRGEDELSAALEERDGLRSQVAVSQEALEESRGALRTLEELVGTQRQERDGARTRVEELRVALAGLQGEAQHLRETFQEHLDRELPETPPPPVEDLPEMESRLAACRAALERLGPVNLLAAQEHAEQEERHAFLTAQRADVMRSVESLRKTIREIDATSSKRFLATFEEVNRKFGEVFTALFGGGEAEMRLLDDEDLLETGIEIVARPPGKRLQNLMLLSGGEKALTAIALLMALFQSKASPFCILDEVDAPLDDPNTARFLKVLRQMSGETQFIVITHNKLTMQAASTLYGVTMQERGVSKLVSVTLDDVQPESERATA